MCGIVGFLGHLDKQAREESVSHMVSTISHRGPDDEGILSVDDVTLGHRRLSVIDLSEAGHQPMISSDGRYAIVYNGEVYNFKDIKPELSDYPFRSQTDTEVILAAYCKWGKECLKKFNGMFAFAIWDREEKELFVARDRLGIKPLYYYQDSGWRVAQLGGSAYDSAKAGVFCWALINASSYLYQAVGGRLCF